MNANLTTASTTVAATTTTTTDDVMNFRAYTENTSRFVPNHLLAAGFPYFGNRHAYDQRSLAGVAKFNVVSSQRVCSCVLVCNI